jgi:hypothetical protein
MKNMIALTTPSETKLLREAGLIFVHPDCHVSMSGKVKKAALLKNLCTAASEGRLYYRDMRLYAYPEEPQQIRIRIRYKGDDSEPVQIGVVPTGIRGHNDGRDQKRVDAVAKYIDHLSSGTTFKCADICKYLGVNTNVWFNTLKRRPDLKALMSAHRIARGTYFKP